MPILRKLTYSKPIPKGAKIVTRKGVRFARVKTATGGTEDLPLTAAGDALLLETRCWYAVWQAPSGKRCRKKLCANQEASKVMLGDLVKRLALHDIGVVDPFEEQRKRSIREHVEDYHRNLSAQGRTAKHARETKAMLDRVIDGCRFACLDDVSATAVQEHLAKLRDAGRRIELPPGEWLSSNEVADALGCLPGRLARQLAKHPVDRKTENRKTYYRRTTLTDFVEAKSKGVSARTLNAYIVAWKQFMRWCVKDRRRADNPLGHLTPYNADADRRHERRDLSPHELRALFAATGQSSAIVHGLNGTDRLMIYALAASTGLRASELASLSSASFDLGGERPTVLIRAGYAKNRTEALQSLSATLAQSFREYLVDRPAKTALWPGRWSQDAAAMLRRDLSAAGIPYRDDAGKVADFHSLRVSFVTMLANSGIHVRTVQELARHSDVNLTMGIYAKVSMANLGGAVDSLPALLPAKQIT